MTFFLSLLSLIFAIIAAYPFLIFPLALRWLLIAGFKRRDDAFTWPSAELITSVSVCVCAYNEEHAILEKCRNLLALTSSSLQVEVLIYVDCASDNTEGLLREYGQGFTIVVGEERRGKTWGMRELVGRARGQIVVFSDANVLLEPGSLELLARYFSNAQVGCVCGHLVYNSDPAFVTASNGGAYWRLEERIKDLESQLGWVMGADGAIFAIRRALYRPPPPDIIDDMYVSLDILCNGYLIVRAPDVVARENSATSAVEEYRRKIRIACQAFNVHRLLWPRLRSLPKLAIFIYASHKLIRWFTIYWLLGSALFGMLAFGQAFGAANTAFGMALIVVLTILLALGRNRIVLTLVDCLMSFVATGIGIVRSLLGDRFQTWTPAASRSRPE